MHTPPRTETASQVERMRCAAGLPRPGDCAADIAYSLTSELSAGFTVFLYLAVEKLKPILDDIYKFNTECKQAFAQ